MDDENSNFSDFIKFFVPLCHTYNVERRMNIRLVELSCGKWGHHLAATGRIVTKSKLFWLGFEGRLRIVTRIRHEGKVIYPKYSKHWPYTVAHTIDCVCSKILNHGLNLGLLFSLSSFLGELTWKFRIKI